MGVTNAKRGTPLLAQETPRSYTPKKVYHVRDDRSMPGKEPRPPKKPSGVFLAFVIGIVAGLIIGILSATTLNAAIHDFESNPHGAVQQIRMEVSK